MDKDKTAAELIAELYANPEKFYESGRSYQLLQIFFHGEPVETLKPLFASENGFVRRAAAFIASELGKQARELVKHIIPFLYVNDRYLQYHAMEVIAVCAKDDLAHELVEVAWMLECDDEVLRLLAMELISRVDLTQLSAARSSLDASRPQAALHDQGLRVLMATQQDPGYIQQMITDVNPLTRRYGAIAAKRLEHLFPSLMKSVEASEDADLRNLSRSR